MEKKEMYVAPEVEIITVSVEKGFAGSSDDVPGGGVDVGDPDVPVLPFYGNFRCLIDKKNIVMKKKRI